MFERIKKPEIAALGAMLALGVTACGGSDGVGALNLVQCEGGLTHNSFILGTLPNGRTLSLEGGDAVVQSLGKGMFEIDLQSSSNVRVIDGANIIFTPGDGQEDGGTGDTLIIPHCLSNEGTTDSEVIFDDNGHQYDIAGMQGPDLSTRLDISATCS